MSDSIRAALEAAVRETNSKHDDAFILPRHAASILATFLWAPDISKQLMMLGAGAIAVAVERAAKEENSNE